MLAGRFQVGVIAIGLPVVLISGCGGNGLTLSGSGDDDDHRHAVGKVPPPGGEAGSIVGIPVSPCDPIDFSMGNGQDCVLRRDGNVACWKAAAGKREKTSLSVTGGLVSPFAVAAGHEFVCAISGVERRLGCWGTLQRNVETKMAPWTEPIPIDRAADLGALNQGVVDVQASWNSFCALTEAGDVWCLGGPWPTLTRLAPPHLLSFAMGAREGVWGMVSDSTWQNLSPAVAAMEPVLGSAFSADEGFWVSQVGPRELRLGGHQWLVSEASFDEDIRAVDLPISRHFLCAHGDHLFCLGSMDIGAQAPIAINGVEPRRIDEFPGIIQEIETGWDYVCALNDRREIWCFGSNVPGQPGLDPLQPAVVGATKLDLCPQLSGG